MLNTLKNSTEYIHWKKAAERLEVSYWWFHRRIKDGRLEHQYDHRGQLFISIASLEQILDDCWK